ADQFGKFTPPQSVGRIEEPPFAYQIIVDTQGETAYQIGELVIATKNNQPLQVRDVADVRVLHQDRVQSVGFEGKDAVVLTVFRRLGGNTVNISHDIRDLLARQPPPKNIRATMAYDQSRFISTAVVNVRDAILVGGLFSVLILLAFLRSWRATLIAALAIPVTLAITFLFLHWTGETLNLMSLGGLAVAIGLIIDDTVVVIENIARHLSPHGHAAPVPSVPASANCPAPSANPQSAIRNPQSQGPVDAASGEITGAVIGSTLTTVLVFIPLAFIVGVYGQFFASLSWSLCIAVLVSMVISLTLVPIFAAKFLAGRPMPEPGRVYNFFAHAYEVALDAVLRFSEWVFAALLGAFRPVLGPWLGRVIAIILMFVLVVAPAVAVGLFLWFGAPIANRKYADPNRPDRPPVPLVKGIETGLMPTMDEGAFVVDYWAPSGSPLAETERKARDIESILSKNPDVQSYVRRTGAELGLFATETSRG